MEWSHGVDGDCRECDACDVCVCVCVCVGVWEGPSSHGRQDDVWQQHQGWRKEGYMARSGLQ